MKFLDSVEEIVFVGRWETGFIILRLSESEVGGSSKVFV